MDDPYTPTTEEVRRELAKAIRGQEVTHPWDEIPEMVRGGIQRMYLESADNVLASTWLAAHDATVRAEGAAEMRERAAEVVMAEHEPWAIMRIGQPLDMAKVMADSPLQMFARRAAAIRALPPLSPQPDTTPNRSGERSALGPELEAAMDEFFSPSADPEPTGDEQPSTCSQCGHDDVSGVNYALSHDEWLQFQEWLDEKAQP